MIYVSIIAALLLFAALVATISRSLSMEPDRDFYDMDGQDTFSREPGDDANERLYPEVLLRAFGDEDKSFVDATGAPRIQRLFIFERKRIALNWIRRKSKEARLIMGEHVRQTREASDLKISGELRIAFQYIQLLALCQLLALLVFFVGPAGLHGLALRANATLQDMRRFGEPSVPTASEA